MKTKIISQDKEKEEIDWSKPQYVKHLFSPLIIITNGLFGSMSFSGISIKKREYSRNWDKSEFTPIKSPITIEISND